MEVCDLLDRELKGQESNTWTKLYTLNICNSYVSVVGFLSGPVVKNLPTMQEMQEMRVQSQDQEDSLEEGTATHSSILMGKSHGQRVLVGYGPRWHKRSNMTEVTEQSWKKLSM